MANLITLSRVILLFVVVFLMYRPASPAQLLNVPLLIVLFVTDALDGYVARKRNEATVFGAMFDIAGDRIVEYTLWIVMAHLGLVPVWVPLVFVIRGTVTDMIRASQVSSEQRSPFAMLRSPIGKWIVAGQFMRVFYAVVKATAFCWLALIQPLPHIAPEIWADASQAALLIGQVLVGLSVALCIVRALPVVIEFAYAGRIAAVR